MASHSSLEILRDSFQETIIPWAKSNELRPFLVQFPLASSMEIEVKSMPAGQRSSVEIHPFSINPERWPQLGLHACRYPCFGCVLEGETDISFGQLSETGLKGGEANASFPIKVLSLQARDFFLIPAGMPYSSGRIPHWHRAKPETASAKTLWMRVLPMGPICQISTTQGLTHKETGGVLIRDARLLSLVEFLMSSAEELPQSLDVVSSCLQALLLTIDRGWSQSHVLVEETSFSLRALQSGKSIAEKDEREVNAAVERARDYIGRHLIRCTLSLPQIAENAYISVSQLKRLFRAELNMTVMEYVSLGRVEVAKSMLAETDLPVGEIGYLSGYLQRTHFSRLFKRHVGLSPREFRNQCNRNRTEKKGRE